MSTSTTYKPEGLVDGARTLLEANAAGIFHIPSLLPIDVLPRISRVANREKSGETLKDIYYELTPGAAEMDRYVVSWLASHDLRLAQLKPVQVRTRKGNLPLHRDLKRESPLALSIRFDTEPLVRRFVAATGATAVSTEFIEDYHKNHIILSPDIMLPEDEGIVVIDQMPGDGVLVANYPIRTDHMVLSEPSTTALIFTYNLPQ